VRNLYVPLPEPAIERLRELARRELRDPKSQATVLILDGLRRAGFDSESSPRGRDSRGHVGRSFGGDDR
jgi:hypothetical protein